MLTRRNVMIGPAAIVGASLIPYNKLSIAKENNLEIAWNNIDFNIDHLYDQSYFPGNELRLAESFPSIFSRQAVKELNKLFLFQFPEFFDQSPRSVTMDRHEVHPWSTRANYISSCYWSASEWVIQTIAAQWQRDIDIMTKWNNDVTSGKDPSKRGLYTKLIVRPYIPLIPVPTSDPYTFLPTISYRSFYGWTNKHDET